MSFDISHYLEQWEYQPGQVVVRKFVGKDGREKIQLRVDLGLLQMNATGRPDGKLPFGHESLYEHFQNRLRLHLEGTSAESPFRLSAEDCAKLQQEAIQYHHRYICLFQLKEFDAVLRDADRNLLVFDFVDAHAESPEHSWAVAQLRPQLLLMRIRAEGTREVEAGRHDEAILAVETGLETVKEFFRKKERPELAENSGEVMSLEAWLHELRSARPMSEKETLEETLREAIKREDYEKAAECRDALRNLVSAPKQNT